MANKAHIYLNGIIGDQGYDFFFEPLPSFDSKIVQNLLDENRDATTIVCHITSNGGNVDEAFAIYDKLTNSKKKIITIAEGTVASAATIVYLAGSERQMTKYAELMIHNPYAPHVEGDADKLQKVADELQRVEDKIAKLYSDTTGTDVKKFDKWMKEEKYMDAEEALSLGFATEVIEPVKAVAYLNSQKSNSQNQNSFMKNLGETILAKMASFESILKGEKQNEAAALNLTAADGRMLEIETEAEKPEIGNKVTIDGKGAEDGDYTMPDASVIKVVKSKITEIVPAQQTDDTTTGAADNADVVALQKENEELKKERDALKTKVENNEVMLGELNVKMEKLGEQITSKFNPQGRKQTFTTTAAKGEVNKMTVIKERFEEAEAGKK